MGLSLACHSGKQKRMGEYIYTQFSLSHYKNKMTVLSIITYGRCKLDNFHLEN